MSDPGTNDPGTNDPGMHDTAERSARVDALFAEALELPEAERDALLDERCGGDPSLRAEVEDLLRLAQADAPAFDAWMADDARLHASLPPSSPHDQDTESLHAAVSVERAHELPPDGQRLGAWRIVRRIGQGGMGTVFLVERADGQYEQRAALKLVHAYGASQELQRRFARERRILASLNHVNVGRLFDGGQAPDGRLFFVMEYVEGRPIDRFCDERRLTLDERLELFVRVCAGVQHAHDQLVVHRDLKPSNILASDTGDVKLLDFGIATLLSPEDGAANGAADGDAARGGEARTGPATRVLTPEYASPEQVRGEAVAVASDVYQLGLLLYELLTGYQAHGMRDREPGSRSPADFVQIILEEAPIRPSQRAALADRTRAEARRTTPSALARALRGDLDTITLCALRKEPPRRYASVRDLAEDVQRYRRRLPIRARGDEVRYRAGKFVVRHRTALAWATVALVAAMVTGVVVVGARWRAARDAAYAARVEGLLVELFSLPAPQNPAGAAPAASPATVDYLHHAVRLVRRQFAGQPARLGNLYVQLGRAYSGLGHYQAAADVFREALTLRETLNGPQHADVAQALEWLGQTEHYLGQYARAEASLRRALQIRRAVDGDASKDRVWSMLDLGDLLHTRGALIEAEPLMREAVALLRGLDQPHSLARSLRDLGNVLRDRGSLDDGAAAYRESLQIFRGLRPITGDPGHQTAMTEIFFARLLIQRGALAEAEPLLARGLATLRTLYDKDHPLIAAALRDLGFLRTEQGRFDEAAALLAESLAIFERWLGGDHAMVVRTRVHQAELARRQARHAAAIALATRSLDQFARLNFLDHPAAIDARLTLGEALAAERRPIEAIAPLSDGLSRAERLFVPGDARIARFRQALARVRPSPPPA